MSGWIKLALWNTTSALITIFIILPGQPVEVMQFNPDRAFIIPIAIPLFFWYRKQDWRHMRLRW